MDDAAPRTNQKVRMTFSQTDIVILKSMSSQYGSHGTEGTATGRLQARITKACRKVGIQPNHRRVAE